MPATDLRPLFLMSYLERKRKEMHVCVAALFFYVHARLVYSECIIYDPLNEKWNKRELFFRMGNSSAHGFRDYIKLISKHIKCNTAIEKYAISLFLHLALQFNGNIAVSIYQRVIHIQKYSFYCVTRNSNATIFVVRCGGYVKLRLVSANNGRPKKSKII